MKSTFGSALLFATAGMFDEVVAVEHPLLTSTSDFAETWIDRPKKDDMISMEKAKRYTKIIDHEKRPVIGVLTEPLRGDMYNTQDKFKEHIAEGEDRQPGYIPRAHVQFLEQAGVRVVPVDHRLSRDELITMFDQLNGLYLPGDSHLAVTDEGYKSAFVIAMAYAENEAFEVQEHFPVFMMGNSLSTWVRSKQSNKGVLKDMAEYKHTNSRIDLV